MDLFSAIQTRTSCRQFLPDAVAKDTIAKILDAGVRAPSPLAVHRHHIIRKKQAILDEADRCRTWAVEQSGWKWLTAYKMDFLLQAPVLVAVVGDPKKSGMDRFQEDRPVGYQLACAAAIQNMLLAAHALDLGSLFFTLFDKSRLRRILDISEEKTPVALVCIGKPGEPQKAVPRKDVTEKTIYID